MTRFDQFNSKTTFPGRAISTDTYAALVGGKSRSGNDYGPDRHPVVAMTITLGNAKIPLKINGESIEETRGMSQKEQMDLVVESQIPLLLAGVFGTTSKDIARGGGPGHVMTMVSATTYAAKDKHKYNESIYNLFAGGNDSSLKKDVYETLDLVVLNVRTSGLSDASGASRSTVPACGLSSSN